MSRALRSATTSAGAAPRTMRRPGTARFSVPPMWAMPPAGLPSRGDAGSIFEGIAGQFGQVYPEDYPDFIAPAGGAASAMHYTASQIAAVSYRGPFGVGSAEGSVVYVAFTFETIASLQTRSALMSRILDFLEGVTGVETRAGVPVALALLQNYPNPFNPTTTIEFTLPSAGQASLTIYDVLGREVARLVDGPMIAGGHRIGLWRRWPPQWILLLYAPCPGDDRHTENAAPQMNRRWDSQTPPETQAAVVPPRDHSALPWSGDWPRACANRYHNPRLADRSLLRDARDHRHILRVPQHTHQRSLS